jgi:hypothetical protein
MAKSKWIAKKSKQEPPIVLPRIVDADCMPLMTRKNRARFDKNWKVCKKIAVPFEILNPLGLLEACDKHEMGPSQFLNYLLTSALKDYIERQKSRKRPLKIQ